METEYVGNETRYGTGSYLGLSNPNNGAGSQQNADWAAILIIASGVGLLLVFVIYMAKGGNK